MKQRQQNHRHDSSDEKEREEEVEYDEEEPYEESSSSDESEEENLALDGVVNDDDGVSTSSEGEDDDDGPPTRKRMKTAGTSQAKMKKKKKKVKKDKELQVEFLFCDVDTKYWDGIKTLLSCEPMYAPHSSRLATSMIENTMVGTVVTTEDQEDVFAVSSIVHCTKFTDDDWLKKCCLQSYPSLSTKTTGFFIHARVINVPISIVHTLHQQLLLDIEWASQNNKEEEEFQTIVLFSPCCGNIYKYFEDEIFASNAELVIPIDIPKTQADDKQCNMIIMTQAQHKASIEEISKLVT